jgi:hypothetical protein
MSTLTSRTNIAALAFVVDLSSVVRGPGKQIDWDKVSDRYLRAAFKVTVGSGGIALGAQSLPVTALPVAVKAGQLLKFGVATDVVVTVGVAGAAANDTTIPVAALSGPIPSGTDLDFGGKKFARTTAAAAAGATSLTVSAIPTALVSGDAATYQGGERSLLITADAAVGATAIAVEDAPFAVVAGEVAYIPDTSVPYLHGGAKFIPGGTVMCTIAASGKMVPRSDRPGSEAADAIIETDASSDSRVASLTGYGRIRAGSLFENRLPDAINNGGTLPSGYKTELAANAGSFIYNTSHDSRGD